MEVSHSMNLPAQKAEAPIEIFNYPSAGRLSTIRQRSDENFSVIKGPAFLFMALEVIDGFLTMWATNNGFGELNPLAVMYSRTWLFPASKMATAILGAIALLPTAKRFSGFIRTGFMLASLFIAAVILSNLYEMGVSLR